MRGKGFDTVIDTLADRITPAYAGKRLFFVILYKEV